MNYDNKKITCCFTGHRSILTEEYNIVFKKTLKITECLIKQGYVFFQTGGALGFDTIAALSVLKLKKIYSDVKLVLVLPCFSQTRGWNDNNIVIYEKIKQKADKVIYTSEEYTKGCMQKRNRYLVDYSSACVCYLNHNKGGTFYTVNYARQNNLKIINIACDYN